MKVESLHSKDSTCIFQKGLRQTFVVTTSLCLWARLRCRARGLIE